MATDAAQSDDSDGLTAELGPLEPLPIPFAAAHRLRRPRNVAGLREQEAHGMLRGTDRIRARRVHHGDAAPGGGMHVDVVDAGDRESPRLNSRHLVISYAVLC